jgi:ketosteroid isomerase-like protein
MTMTEQGTEPDVADADVALIQAAYAAYARGDIDEVVASLHPQVVWIEPDEFPGGGRRVGPPAVADYLRASRSGWAELNSAATVYRQGATVVALHHLSGRLANGTPHEATVADVFTVRGGQVVRMHAYADPAEADAAADA